MRLLAMPIVPYFSDPLNHFLFFGCQVCISLCTVVLAVNIAVVGMRRNLIMRSIKVYLLRALVLRVAICNSFDIVVLLYHYERKLGTTTSQTRWRLSSSACSFCILCEIAFISPFFVLCNFLLAPYAGLWYNNIVMRA